MPENAQVQTTSVLHTCTLSSCVCVLHVLLCLYLCYHPAFGSGGAPGDRKGRQTQFDVAEFPPIRELKTGNKRKGEP